MVVVVVVVVVVVWGEAECLSLFNTLNVLVAKMESLYSISILSLMYDRYIHKKSCPAHKEWQNDHQHGASMVSSLGGEALQLASPVQSLFF